MAALLGRQWSVAVIVHRPSSNAPCVAAQPVKSISVKSSDSTTTAIPGAKTATAAAASSATTSSKAAAVVVVASSQQSSAKIKRSNRRSRFGEPLKTFDSEDDNDLCCEALSADFHLLETGLLEDELSGRKNHRKGRRLTRAGGKRLDSLAPMAQVQTGIKLKSSPLSRELRKPPVDDEYVISVGDKFLTRKAWEEKAYQIIRRQKLRDAALAETKAVITVQTPPTKALVRAPDIETLVTNTTNLSLQLGAPQTLDSIGTEDAEVSSLSKRLGLEDKCEAVVAYLHSLGVREREFSRIMDRHKACLQANVNVVKERVEFLLSLGVQFQHLPKLIVRHPQVLEYRVEQAMKPRVVFFKSLGLDESKIGKIITVSPSLLECSLEKSMKPRIAYLVKNVGIKPEDIGKIVMRSPQILTQSIEDALEPRLNFYLHELKLSREELAKMITRHPQLLHYSLKNGVRPRVKYLRSLGMSNADITKVLTRLTQILSLSVENCLQPKFDYLVQELKGDVNTVTSFPAYFSLSLDQRIIPRHKYLQLLKRTPSGPFPMRLLTISDLAFCKWANSGLEAYDKFRHDLLLSTFAKKFEYKNKVHV